MKKASLTPKNEYVIVYQTLNNKSVQEVVGYRNACDVFRYMKKLYGDNVRMAQVIVNYGEDIL